jgi:hypothetical protein
VQFGRESVFRDIYNIPTYVQRHIDIVLEQSDIILAIVARRGNNAGALGGSRFRFSIWRSGVRTDHLLVAIRSLTDSRWCRCRGILLGLSKTQTPAFLGRETAR